MLTEDGKRLAREGGLHAQDVLGVRFAAEKVEIVGGTVSVHVRVFLRFRQMPDTDAMVVRAVCLQEGDALVLTWPARDVVAVTGADCTVSPSRGKPVRSVGQAKRAQRRRQRERLHRRIAELETERNELCAAIAHHRSLIEDAGEVRVDEWDEAAAQRKHEADRELWSHVEP